MKKIITFFGVLTLIFTLSLPCFAATVSTGNIVFRDTIDVNSFVSGTFNATWSCNGDTGNQVKFSKESDSFHVIFIKGYQSYCLVTYHLDGTFRTSYVPGDLIISQGNEDFFNALNVVAHNPICDGSTCPATDLNKDNICDDCGMTFSVLRVYDYPELPVVVGNNLHSVVLQRDNELFYMVLTSDTPYSISGNVGESYMITIANEQEVNYFVYKCTDGENWVQDNSGKAYMLSVGAPSSILLNSTFDWWKDGTLFFQVPLHQIVGGVVETSTKSQWDQLRAGTITTLTLCGVGCLALLIVLKLFGKRSQIFRL